MEPYDYQYHIPQASQPTPQKKSGFGIGFLVGMLVMLVFVFGFFNVRNIYQYISNATSASGTGTLTDAATLNKVKKIEEVINKYYYKDEDISLQKMRNGMYAGIVDSLDDPYSVYYDEEELQELINSTEGVYYGIGAYMMMNESTGCAEVSGVIADTPAEGAGLRAGDMVLKVNDENVQGLDLNAVVKRVRGEEGTPVQLTIYRAGEPDYLVIDLIRAKVVSPTVTHEMKDHQIGYIQITEFDDVTLGQFKEAYADIKSQDAKGLIIDLRGNPGGNVDTVVDICREFLPKGLVFFTEDKYGKREEYKCDGTKKIKIPLVVLVDSYSASASEILSGAVKDYGIGKLVGTTTFGKGIVQRVISLNDGTAIKVTESSYYTPSGKNIHGIGIDPDVEVPFDGEAYYNDGVDNQLEAGIETILEMTK